MNFTAALATACFATSIASAQAPESASALAPESPEILGSPVEPVDVAPPPPTPAEEAEFTRLFGDAAADPAVVPVAEPPTASLPIAPPWVWGVLLVAVAGLFYARSRLLKPPASGLNVRVVGRTLLGREGNLAVVEVSDGGRVRRMLVGYGGGAPRLVADLTDADAEAAQPNPGAFQAVLRRTGAQRRPRAEAPPDNRNLKARDDLIAEVLAERGTVSLSTPDLDAPETDEDDPSAETYTFRGLLG